MRQTKEKVSLQTEAKDIVRHISGTSMEAGEAVWPEEGKPILIIRNDKAVEAERKEMVYWQDGNKIFFASKVNRVHNLRGDTIRRITTKARV